MSERETDLEARVKRLEKALALFVLWTAQSANSPIRSEEARHLLETLEVGG